MSSTISDQDPGVRRVIPIEGWRGGLIPAHRGLRIMPREQGWRRPSLLMGPLFALAVGLLARPIILPLWGAIEAFWCGQAAPVVKVILVPYALPWRANLAIPVPDLAATSPTREAWMICAALLVVDLLMALFLRRRHLPLALALFTLAVVFVVGAAAFTPLLTPFPYVLVGYIQSMLLMGLALMVVTPLMFMAIYYPLDFSVTKKIALTLVALTWLAVALPCQFCLQAFAVRSLGLVALPTLFLLAGILLDVMGLVAVYSWGMSWRSRYE